MTTKISLTEFEKTIADGDDQAVREAIHKYFQEGSQYSYDTKVLYLVRALSHIRDARESEWARTMISVVMNTSVNLTQGPVPVIISKMMYGPLAESEFAKKAQALMEALRPLLKGKPNRDLREKISRDVTELARTCTKSTWARLLRGLDADGDFSDIVAIHPNVKGWQIADKESAADSRPHVGIYSFLVR